MAKAGQVRATTAFVFEHDGATVVVHEGDAFASTHPAVKKHAELFAAPEAAVTAVTAPGEKRKR